MFYFNVENKFKTDEILENMLKLLVEKDFLTLKA